MAPKVWTAPGPNGKTPADHTIHFSGVVNMNINMSNYTFRQKRQLSLITEPV